MAEAHSPLEQFEVHRLVDMRIGDFDVSFTNASAMMVLVVIATTALLTISMRGRAMVPGRWQSIAELAYGLVASALRDNVGADGRRYFPFVFTLFMFILLSNLLGLIPFSFTVTSHIVVTFALAVVVFLGVTVIAIWRHGFKFLTYFVPPGVPIFLAPLMVPIEIFSYFVRPLSLAVRLAANMIAGHTMIAVFASFVIALGFLGFAPLVFIVALYGLEVLVAFLQAYVFAVLTCLYLNDALHLHH